MKKLLLIALLIVGCDEAELITEHTHSDLSITDTLYVYEDTLFIIDTFLLTHINN